MDEGGGRYRGDAESGAPQAGESLTDTLFDEGFDAFVGRLQERPLREHIGHTPVQVVAGAVTGIVIGIAVSFSVVGLE
jgi:acid phosphatase family membrane protein YuiD